MRGLLQSTYGRIDVIKDSQVWALLNIHTPGGTLAELTGLQATPEMTIRDDLTHLWELHHICITQKEIYQDSVIALQHFDDNKVFRGVSTACYPPTGEKLA